MLLTLSHLKSNTTQIPAWYEKSRMEKNCIDSRNSFDRDRGHNIT